MTRRVLAAAHARARGRGSALEPSPLPPDPTFLFARPIANTFRVGGDNALRGLRLAIRYAKSVRHDLANVRNDLVLNAELVRETGHVTVADLLLLLDQKLDAIARQGEGG